MKNPFLNAFAAGAYIGGIVLLMNATTSLTEPKDMLIVPLAMLGLFTLSAAVMGFLFLSQPFQLYFDGKKNEAVAFFGKTVGTFAVLVAVLVVIMFLILRR